MVSKLDTLALDIGIDQEFAAAAGYFLISFSHLEEEMNRAIWAILNIANDSSGSVVTTSIRDFGQRMILLAKLGKARLRDDKSRGDCSNVIRGISNINKQRVQLVHGAFSAYDLLHSVAIVVRSTAERTEVRHIPAEFTTEYLCDLTAYTLLVAQGVTTFRHNVRDGTDHALPLLDKVPRQPA